MDVVGDAVSRDRRSNATALRSDSGATDRSYDYRRFCTSAWKIGNFLRHHGIRSGDTVGIADDPVPEPVLTLYGAALLGAQVSFEPSRTQADADALVVPVSECTTYQPPPGAKLIAYGGDPEDPTMAYFERDVWSENPTAPPDIVDKGDVLLETEHTSYTHGAVLRAAKTVIDRLGLTDEAVVVDGSFTEPGIVAGGLIAPIVAGGSVVLTDDPTAADGEYTVGGPDGDIDPSTLL
ncbi:MAG: AMP-binding protein [Natronomonas sp.]